MTHTLDDLLKALQPTSLDRSLDQLEPAVWSRIEADKARRSAGDRSLRMQLMVAGMALGVGLALGWSKSVHEPREEGQSLYASYAELGPVGRLESGL